VMRSRSIARAFSASRGVSFSQFFSGRPGLMYAPDDVNTLSTSRTGASFGGLSASSAVGMMLDVARGGLEGLGAELVTNGNFSNGATNWNFSSGVTAPAGQAEFVSVAQFAGANQTFSALAVNKTYAVDFDLVTNTSGTGLLVRLGGTGNFVSSGTALGKKRMLMIPGATTGIVQFLAASSGTTLAIDNISVRELPGCHQVAPSDAARPVLEAFAGTGPLAARFNGTDRSMGSLTTLDLTSTDEVTVIAAVRSLADGFTQAIVEFSSNFGSTAGAFALLRSASNAYSGNSRGSASATAAIAAFLQPDNALIVARAKISTPSVSIARNRATATSNASSQGTGNYGNHTVFLGARNNASLRFDGQIGRLAIIGGALTAEEELIATGLVATPYGL
jgi:hypothetical protein